MEAKLPCQLARRGLQRADGAVCSIVGDQPSSSSIEAHAGLVVGFPDVIDLTLFSRGHVEHARLRTVARTEPVRPAGHARENESAAQAGVFARLEHRSTAVVEALDPGLLDEGLR